ncbi:hypothetical protein E0Z10_g2231 [Xylaria hypoxylon]|uniref:Fucose-specific lectin n=1 Tax=Xylaria hypoxylon TaxID=37992 RepID=A0A4Z0YQE3_9PEZI|nr:hypothetical protein E0Z10_g2231 [Xylaria hypoxylon]
MASIIGLIHPAENSIGGDQLLAYYINANNNLALKIIPLGAPDGLADVYTTNDVNVKGYVTNPSSLAVMPVKNIMCIYGVITSSKIGIVSLLSPVLQPLGIQCETTGASSTLPGLTVYQASVTSVSSTLNEVEVYTAGSDKEIGNATYLAAYYNVHSAERHIVFQKNDDVIVDYNIDHGDTYVTNAKPGRSPTGLAVVFVPELRKAFLYYVRAYTESQVSKYDLWKTETKQGKTTEWEKPVKVTPAMDILQTTQLHVTAWPERGENYITYFNSAGQAACLHDRWDTVDGSSE